MLAGKIASWHVSLGIFAVRTSVSIVTKAHGTASCLEVRVAVSVDTEVALSIAVVDGLMLAILADKFVFVCVRSTAAIATAVFGILPI